MLPGRLLVLDPWAALLHTPSLSLSRLCRRKRGGRCPPRGRTRSMGSLLRVPRLDSTAIGVPNGGASVIPGQVGGLVALPVAAKVGFNVFEPLAFVLAA